MSQLATLSRNYLPSSGTIAGAQKLGRQIVAAVDAREAIIASDNRIDRVFAIPAGNWIGTGDYAAAYRLLASLHWSELRYLRLRCQNFTGRNLVKMTDAWGLRAADRIPQHFEQSWTEEQRIAIVTHWNALTTDLPAELIVRPPNILGEVGWWVENTIVNLDTIDCQERVNIFDCSGLLARFAAQGIRILEVGGGYGALAQVLSRLLNPRQYVICDLPESLLFSGLYLSFTESTRIRLVGADDNLMPRNEGEIVLLPNYLAQTLLSEERFHLVVNTLSMSEMTSHQVEVYADLIERAIGLNGLFFEQNYDNRPSGMIDCHEYLPKFFNTKKIIHPGPIPLTRGEPVLWSNCPPIF